MGKRITYFSLKEGSTIANVIWENYPKFSTEMFERLAAVDLEEDTPAAMRYSMFMDFLQMYKSLPPVNALYPNSVDELFLMYMECPPNEEDFEFLIPCVSKSRYHASFDLIKATNDPTLIKTWHFLLRGRSLVDDNRRFDALGTLTAIGFLYPEEQKKLYDGIKTHFGDFDQIREKFWTDKEKAYYQDVILPSEHNKTGYSLENHNPKSAGIEYVLQVLQANKDSNKELISYID
jgi:hypothetical protein